jgi:mannose-6-phosphate isomerase
MLLGKVWGGDALARVGKAVAPGATIGESWEVADLASTSTSGAGGGSAQSRIRTGPLAGKTLHDAMMAWTKDMMGDATGAGPNAAHFPLLIKYLDAREHLSVQVHPSMAYARDHRDAHIKTECWYILDAKPGSVIYKGVRPGVTREQFANALRVGKGEGVVELLEAVKAVKGECHNLPSGTVHALGAGVLVAEVQTPSDTTFRVFDWGRTGRELHIEQSLACIMWEQARDATNFAQNKIAEKPHLSRLVTTGYFDVDEARVQGGSTWHCGEEIARSCPLVLMVLAGTGTLHAKGCDSAVVFAGSTFVVPADLAQSCEIRASETITVLRAMPR